MRSEGTLTQTVPLDIVGGTSFDRYRKQSIEATYNMIISDGALVPYAGYKRRLNILPGTEEARGLYKSSSFNHLFVVIEDSLFVVGPSISARRVGFLKTSTGAVYISENNRSEVAIVDGLTVYIYNYDTDTFKTFDETNPLVVPFKPIYITYQDTYFIVADGNSNEWYLSNINSSGDVSFVNPLRAGAIETKPDVSVAAIAFERQLFVFGKNTTEIWHDVGTQLFPYQRDNSVSIDYGCLNAQTIAMGFGRLVWLAGNESASPTIMVSNGGNPQQISTDGINFQLGTLTKPEDASAFIFEQDGHVLYQITFNTDNVTYIYDFNTNKFFNATDNCGNKHIAKDIVYFQNTHYFISSKDAALYEMSTDLETYHESLKEGEKDYEIPRSRITKNFRLPNAESYAINEISITMEQGNTTEDRRVDMAMSKDGGASFGNIFGKNVRALPNRVNRMRFQKLGSANDCVFQFRFWGKFRFVVIGATMSYWR
ncbi:MAG: hypothetical protein JSW00_04070 [Thermoplasmata archaeon]|nr:MAG: hypothetical protein JSW00_04070 [Thermoplasmata archaeon]